jgi:hypothetical protein
MVHNKVSIFHLYQGIIDRLARRIADEPDNFIIGTPIGELVDYYYDEAHFTSVVEDEQRTLHSDVRKVWKTIPAHQRDPALQYQGDLKFEFEYFWVSIPIVPHPQLAAIKNLEPSRYDTGFFGDGDLQWTNDAIVFQVPIKGYGFNKEPQAVAKEVEQSIQWVRNKLSYIASDLEIKNKELMTKIAEFAENRKRKIEEDRARHDQLLKLVNIPVHRRDDDPVKKVRLNPKPVVQRVRPTPQQPEEYTLDEAKVLDIVSLLDNQGRQFEKTPATFQKLGEEDLRDILLVNLNSTFDGAATGETFCAKGKTDIYLSLPLGNILSFECKFWGGQKKYLETIDQLLGYLTWRMNYGGIILLSDQKNFTHVLQEGEKAIKVHPSYRNGFQLVKTGHFRSYHALPTDESKHVQIHHLFYTIATS